MARRTTQERIDGEQAGMLGRLEEAFARLRASQPGRRRVPEALRAQVLAALDAGARPTTVCRACGIARTQLSRWRAQRQTRREAMAEAIEPPRILGVREGGVGERGTGEVGLELSIGGWSVRVRLEPPSGLRR